MGYQVTPLMGVHVLTLLLSLLLAIYAGRRYVRGTKRSVLLSFSALMATISLWVLTEFVSAAVTSADMKLALQNFSNIVPGPLLVWTFFWFALAYAGHDRWVHPWVTGIVAVNVIGMSVILVVSPAFLYDVSGLTTQGPITMGAITIEQWQILDRQLKPPFLLYQLYAYSVILAASGILLRYVVRNRHDLYVGQVAALLGGIGVPLLGNALVFLGVIAPGLNPTVGAFSITAIAFAVAVFNYRLLETVPIGRRQLVDILSDPVIILSADDTVLESNEAARSLTNNETQPNRIPVREFLAEIPEAVEQLDAGSLEGSTISVTDSGREKWFYVTATPIGTAPSEAAGRLVLFRDITPQKRREQALEDTLEDLERSNEKLSRFSDVISHDLRNPLNVSQIHLDMIRDDAPAEHVDALDESLQRMDEMIDDMLTLSRASGPVEETEPVPLRTLAIESWETVNGGNATIETVMPETTAIQAAGARLRHIFENLFRNAVDHNEPPVTVRVGTIGEDGTDGAATPDGGFFVEDDGFGIPAADQEAVQEHGYTTSQAGTGIGLTIVQDIVDAHGWELSIAESSQGGARFEITNVEFAAEK